MQYKTELHAHSRDISLCANASAETIVEKYLSAGYDALVLCNHFNYDTFRGKVADGDFAGMVKYFVDGFRKLETAAQGSGLHVMFGAEIRFNENWNDYLLYGATEEFLLSVPDMLKMGAGKFSKIARENGMLFFQAHPFRFGMTVTNPANLDGIEVYNGHPWHNSNNDIAEAWAEKYNLLTSAGTDFHDNEHQPVTGILTDFPVRDNQTLLKTLRERNFSIIK